MYFSVFIMKLCILHKCQLHPKLWSFLWYLRESAGIRLKEKFPVLKERTYPIHFSSFPPEVLWIGWKTIQELLKPSFTSLTYKTFYIYFLSFCINRKQGFSQEKSYCSLPKSLAPSQNLYLYVNFQYWNRTSESDSIESDSLVLYCFPLRSD